MLCRSRAMPSSLSDLSQTHAFGPPHHEAVALQAGEGALEPLGGHDGELAALRQRGDDASAYPAIAVLEALARPRFEPRIHAVPRAISLQRAGFTARRAGTADERAELHRRLVEARPLPRPRRQLAAEAAEQALDVRVARHRVAAEGERPEGGCGVGADA